MGPSRETVLPADLLQACWADAQRLARLVDGQVKEGGERLDCNCALLFLRVLSLQPETRVVRMLQGRKARLRATQSGRGKSARQLQARYSLDWPTKRPPLKQCPHESCVGSH